MREVHAGLCEHPYTEVLVCKDWGCDGHEVEVCKDCGLEVADE